MDFGNILKQSAIAGLKGLHGLIAPKVGSPQEGLEAFASNIGQQPAVPQSALQDVRPGLTHLDTGKRLPPSPPLSMFDKLKNEAQMLLHKGPAISPIGYEPSSGSLPMPTVTPMPTATPMPIRIAIPSANGPGETVVPQNIADILFKVFEPYKQATNAAQVMHHPMQISGLPQEIARGINDFGNRGENPNFDPRARNDSNVDGTIDHGLMQNNSGTFDGMMAQPFWRAAMQRRGINSFEDLLDPEKSAEMSLLTLMRGNWDRENQTMKENPRWTQWYAAPRRLR